MRDWNAITAAALAERFPNSLWDVLAGEGAPPGLTVCRTYPSLQVALDALLVGGFKPSRLAIVVPGQHSGRYDTTTAMKFEGADGAGVVLVRQLES